MANYYIDTEFLEGTQTKRFLGIPFGKTKPTIDLISIGIVSEDNMEYYAISKNFNLKEAWNRYDLKDIVSNHPKGSRKGKVYWIRENVLKPIYKELHSKENLYARQALYRANIYIKETEFNFTYSNLKKLIKKYGKTNKEIAEEVKVFCTGDVLSIEKAKYYEVQHKPCKFYAYYSDYDWVAFCWLFGKMMDLPKGFPMYCIDLKQELDRIQQFHIDRYKAGDLKTFGNYPKQTNEHNALADARWNKELHNFLNNL